MADIVLIAERAPARQQRLVPDDLQPTGTATILLFTGVWHERIADVPEPEDDAVRGRRRRSRA